MTNPKTFDAFDLVIAFLYRLVSKDTEAASALLTAILTAISGGEDTQRRKNKITEGHERHIKEIELPIASLKQRQDVLRGLLRTTEHYYLR